MASEEYKESEAAKLVKKLMDEEGFEFGEAVREAIRQTKNFESKADGGSIGIEVLFEKKKNGGRIGFQGGGMDASKSDFKSPSSRTYSRSYNPGAGGVVQHSSGGGGGGGPKGPGGPPSIINPPTKDKSTELLTFDKYTGKPMTFADVATANKFLNFVKTQGGYKMGEDTEADALYDAYRTATGRDTFMQDATVDSVINMRATETDGNLKQFFDKTSTITDNPTGRMTKSLVVDTPTSFTQRFITPTGIMENDVPQKFGAPQSLSVDPYSNNIIGSDLRAEVGKQDIQASKMKGFKNMDYDTYKTIMDMKGGTKITPFEFEGLKEGTITEPGTFTAADGGRVGLFMGGPPLEGQALAIYNSMKAYGEEDQAIADRLQSLGYYTPGGSTPDTPSDNIIGSQINQGAGGGGGITELQKTYTRETAPPQKFIGDPTAQLTGRGRLDPMGSGFEETLKSVTAQNTNPLLDRDALAKKAFFEEVYQDPREISFFDKAKSGLQSFKDKFFQPKVKGTLGDRLQKQFEFGQKLPSFVSKIAGIQSPFNPESKNYNPLIAGQLNFLEASPMVTRKSGQFLDPKFAKLPKDQLTKDMFMDVTGALIGRDPNTGGLKYGPGSVLAGKNVISGFGTNDYETALMDYITKMRTNKKISETGRLARLAAAEAELEAERERQRQAGQRTTNQGTLDYGITQGISERDYRSIDRTRERSDRQDEGKGPGGSTFDYSDPYDPGGGEKDGGFIDGYNRRKYSDGGLATMFTRRR